MIFKITFDNGQSDWCTAKDQLHLLKSYDADYVLSLQEIKTIEEVPDSLAMITMVKNTEYDDTDPDDTKVISIHELAVGDDFCIIASTEFV